MNRTAGHRARRITIGLLLSLPLLTGANPTTSSAAVSSAAVSSAAVSSAAVSSAAAISSAAVSSAVSSAAAAAVSPSAAHRATSTQPPAAERTMPNLKFTCPAALGDHAFAGILPDGPLQEQCFYQDKHGSEFAVGASWETRPADPTDSRATCVEAAKTVWHETSSNGYGLARYSPTRRANGYLFLNLYAPDAEKLARQRALLGQLEALSDEMLAAAVTLAQPCYPATPTASATPSDTAEPSDSPAGTIEATTSPTNREPLCDTIDGALTDNARHPVPGIVVRLTVAGPKAPIDTTTDAQGRFRFGDLPDTDQARDDHAATISALIRDGEGTWRVYAGKSEATLVTDPFPLLASGGCRHDLTTASLDGYATTNPATVARWADLWTVVTELRRAGDYAKTQLDVTLRDVPVVVYAWCPSSLNPKACTRIGSSAFASERSPTDADLAAGLGNSGRLPYIAIAAHLTDQLGRAPQDDTVYHEFGHILQADLARGFSRLNVAGRTPHAGYANASSNDSWVEGFASWFAITLRQADGRPEPSFVWAPDATITLHHEMKAWDANGTDEEWAVAALLTDLVDGPTPDGAQGRSVPCTLSRSLPVPVIDGTVQGADVDKDVIIVELYDAAGTLLGRDRAYLFNNGNFIDVPSIDFATAKAFLRPASSPTAGRDDDGFTVAPHTVVRILTDPPNVGTRGGRPDHASMVFDLQELYTVLRSKAQRPEDVDALFIAHGFFENLTKPNDYVTGAKVGLTSHRSATTVLAPRYDTQIQPQRLVTVDTGTVNAQVIVFPQGGVPYRATPDAEHRVPVMVPGSLDSRTAVVTLADGSRPAVNVIEGRTFWPEAAKHEGTFLTLQPKLVPVAAASSAPSSDLLVIGTGAGMIVLGFGLGTVVLGRVLRRRQPAPRDRHDAG